MLSFLIKLKNLIKKLLSTNDILHDIIKQKNIKDNLNGGGDFLLQFVLGPSKSGKTTYIDHEILRLSKEKRQIFLIVPEQYTFETEKRLYRKLSGNALSHVTITSFTRMAQTTFKLYGGGAGTYADECAKSILMAQAAAEAEGELSVYLKSAKNDAFIHTMLSAVTEFKNAGVDPEKLRACALQIEDVNLRQKAKETALLYGTYDALLHAVYLDPLDDITRAAALLEKTDFFENTTVFFDEFKGFMGNEVSFIRLILRRAERVVVAFCIDPVRAGEKDSLFHSVVREQHRLERYARQENILIQPPVKLSRTYYTSSVLARLERILFSPNRESANNPEKNLRLVLCRDAYEEAEYTAAMIRMLVRDEGYAYRDIAVLSRVPEQYDEKLATAFSRLTIPLFTDQTKPAADHPLIRFIESALACSAYGFTSERVLALVKSGMCGITPEEAGIFENYCFVWDVRGEQWRKSFTNHPRGFMEQMTETDTAHLTCAELVRKRIVEPLDAFCTAVRDTVGELFCEAVYRLLCELGVTEEMERRIAAEYETDDFSGAKEEKGIWDAAMALLDTLAVTMKGRRIAPEHFLRLFRIASASLKRGSLPQTADCVTISGTDRFRFADKKVIFVLGANEQLFPLIPSENGIFSERERKILLEHALDISASMDDQLYEERFIAYRALSCASEQLFITASKFSENGAERAVSAEVSAAVCSAGGIMESTDCMPLSLFCQNEHTAWIQLARHYWSDTPQTASLRHVLSERETSAKSIREMERILSKQGFRLADTQNAKQLFGNRMSVSPTKVEGFYRCPFRYFLEHGLKLRPLRRAQLDPIETGSLIHRILYEMLAHLDLKEGYDRAAADVFIRNELERYIEEVMGGVESKTKRFLYLCRRMRQSILRIADHLHEQFVNGGFEPCALEYEIKEDADITPLLLEAADGTRIRIAGKIDRIDRYYSRDGKLYIRIIDYKSGRKQFNLDDVLYGLNLQMLIYLHCIVKNGKGHFAGAYPAGILYMPASDPKPTLSQAAQDEAIQQQWKKSYQMNGLLLNNLEVLDAMDSGFSGMFIPVTCKKDGTFSSDSVASLASLRELGHIGRYIEKLVCNMAEELHDGRIEALPVKDICDYCDYRAVCGHGESSPVRQCPHFNRDEAMKRMEEKDNG